MAARRMTTIVQYDRFVPRRSTNDPFCRGLSVLARTGSSCTAASGMSTAGFGESGLGILATCRLVAVVVAVVLMRLGSRDVRSSSWSLLLFLESDASGLCS